MTTHLSPQEFVEALDATLGQGRLAHLDACESCRKELADLRALMTDVDATAEMPEPSPLFWDHFSTRVLEATSAEAILAPEPWWRAAWRPVAALAACAALVALVVVLRPGLVDEESTPTQAALQSADVDPLAGDEETAIAFMAEAASDLSWEEARAVDLAPKAVAVDTAIERLTASQRAELVKLIREEMRGTEPE